jgi:hypothetical protein
MTRQRGKRSPCSAADARLRLAHARKFLEVAEIVEEEAVPESLNCSAALAVLAGIAAADAACCAALGQRSRSENHRDAIQLLEEIDGGREAAIGFTRLIDMKDTAHYGLTNLNRTNLTRALRAAAQLVRFADRVVGR